MILKSASGARSVRDSRWDPFRIFRSFKDFRLCLPSDAPLRLFIRKPLRQETFWRSFYGLLFGVFIFFLISRPDKCSGDSNRQNSGIWILDSPIRRKRTAYLYCKIELSIWVSIGLFQIEEFYCLPGLTTSPGSTRCRADEGISRGDFEGFPKKVQLVRQTILITVDSSYPINFN